MRVQEMDSMCNNMSEKERLNLPVVVPGGAGKIVWVRGAVPTKPEATPYLCLKNASTQKKVS